MSETERRGLVDRFWRWLDETGPRLHFECSMLQTPVEDEDGVVHYDCDEDEDDWEDDDEGEDDEFDEGDD